MASLDNRRAARSLLLETNPQRRRSDDEPGREQPPGVNVLLVEDNPGDARLVGELLIEAGAEEFDLTHVDRLGEAVQRLREDHFDVVLLDLSLPDSNGFDTVVRLQAAGPHVPIVVLTGLDDDLVGLQAVRGGVEDFLIKGEWDANRLARSIRYAIWRRNATQALARSETLLAIADFASGTAHHLNNLFMVISGRLSLLLESHGTGEIKRSLQIVLEATARGAEIVRRLQAFTRAEPLSEATRVDLNEVVQHALELTRPCWQDDARARGVRIDAVLELERIPSVLGDSFTLHEVVMNMVFNAVDALPDGGRLTIKTWASDQWVHCSVADTGVGMPEHVQRRAVEPFFTTKGPKATGLGLSIAHGILKRHRGDLAFESAEGHGTTVTMSLPLRSPGG